MSWGYGVLLARLFAACVQVGLDPYLGFFHVHKDIKPCKLSFLLPMSSTLNIVDRLARMPRQDIVLCDIVKAKLFP